MNLKYIYYYFKFGGKRSRTADNRRAKAMLYQLSYTPAGPFWIWTRDLTLIRGAL